MAIQSGEQAPALPGAASSERYEGVGHSLKVVRERRGFALTDVSARLRIRRHYLEAIETGQFGELPGAVYINGFLRQYAEYLGLDAEQVLKNYQAEADASLQRPSLNFPMPRPEERSPRIWLVLGALVLAGVVYTLWYRHQETLRFGQDLIQAVPGRLADLVPSPQPIAPTPQSPAQIAIQPAAPAQLPVSAATPALDAAAPAAPAPVPVPAGASTPASDETAPADPPAATAPPAGAEPAVATPSTDGDNTSSGQTSPATEAGVPPAIPATPAAPETVAAEAAGPEAAPAAPAAPVSYGALPGDSRIRLEATAPAWIQVRGPNNEQVFTRLLNTGERYLVPDRNGLTLLTGNAGGVRVVIDGQALPPLGADGEVKRGIPLDPEQLKSDNTERQG